MTEVVLFLGVGLIAIVAAVMMLLSENAVHSALFLVINFACVAFFYLMLDAPFLAMVQIAVYAGAIMVLFLFVIMLLGAEKGVEPTRPFRWLPIMAIALAGGFLLITGIAIVQGEIDLTGPTYRPPEIRVVNANPDLPAIGADLTGAPIANEVGFKQSSGFSSVGPGPGTYTLNITEAGTDTVLASTDVTLETNPERARNTYTAVVYDLDGTPTIFPFYQDTDTTPARTARVTVFNAFNVPVDLVDLGSEMSADDNRVILSDIAPGELVVLPDVSEDVNGENLAFVAAGTFNTLYSMADSDLYRVERDTAQLVVLTGERLFDGSLRAVALPFVERAVASFGGPQAIGELLFTKYLLPFQLIALLLLAAMIGAIVLTHKEGAVPRRRDVRRVVSKPLTAAIASQVGRDIMTSPAAEEPPPLPEGQTEPAGD